MVLLGVGGTFPLCDAAMSSEAASLDDMLWDPTADPQRKVAMSRTAVVSQARDLADGPKGALLQRLEDLAEVTGAPLKGKPRGRGWSVSSGNSTRRGSLNGFAPWV